VSPLPSCDIERAEIDTNPGIIVCNGRFPGATVFGNPGSIVNPGAAIVQRETGASDSTCCGVSTR
jgi:hypothetical protein